jgi:hypothetical protein
MGVRVKIRISIGKIIECVALANSGFETDTPQLLVPTSFILKNRINVRRLGKPESLEYDTAGGPVMMYVYHRACSVNVVESDRVSQDVIADLVISPIEKEVIMSDALIEDLGILIVSPRKGFWRFLEEPSGKIRQSYPKQYW